MSKPYKIKDWNEDIIQKINDLCENPGLGCDPLGTIEEVTDPHRWSVADIEEARNKLEEICGENEFTTELKLWKQEIVDELKEAIALGWCNCCDWGGPYSLSLPVEVDNYEQKVYDPTWWSQPTCLGRRVIDTNDLVIRPWNIQFGPAGYAHRKFIISIVGYNRVYRIGCTFYCIEDYNEVTPHSAIALQGTLTADGYLWWVPSGFDKIIVGSEHHETYTSSGFDPYGGPGGPCCSGTSGWYSSSTTTITIGSYAELQALGFNPSGDDPGPVTCV